MDPMATLRESLSKDTVNCFLKRAARKALFAVLAQLAGCTGYYWQAATGQWQLMADRQPIDSLLVEPTTGVELRDRLVSIADLREFAVSNLALPDNGSYREYVQLDRPFVVWNVFAAPALSIEAHQWCYPLLGCLGYRGYFALDDAKQEADSLRQQGLDVWVGGVPAYSTLGWFDDPVLSSFIKWPSGRIAELIFHELAHQRLFIAGDTSFNESYATVVGRSGAELWLLDRGDAAELELYLQDRQRRDKLYRTANDSRRQLEEIYASDLSEGGMKSAKQAVLDELAGRIGALNWGANGPALAESFVAGGNAWFSAVASYEGWVPAFAHLLEAGKGDYFKFHRSAEKLSELGREERNGALQALQSRAE